MGLLTLLGVAGFFTGLATMFALARRWPRTVRALVGALAVVGFVLLGWAMSEGVWGAPGKIDFGSPGAESAFRIGYPLASLGTAAFLTGLIPRDPRWVGSKAAVADVAIRVAGTWIAGGVLGVILYTLVTGYAK